MDNRKYAEELINFIYSSPTAFHAVETVKVELDKNGFTELKQEDRWKLVKGGKYYVTQNDSAIIAFIVGEEDVEKYGFKIIGSHTDSPGFRVKPSPEIISEGSYVKLNTEVYGGPILSTWMDRPLSLAGRITVRGKDIFNPQSKLVNIKRPLLTIPNIAIHMNRNVNEGVQLNKQKDMLPLLSQINNILEKDNCILKLIAKELNINVEEIIDFDLFLYDYEKGVIMGLEEEFISSGRLDDLAMVHSSMVALCKGEEGLSTNVIACFDNEEVGSETKQGAGSQLLSYVLERIMLSFNKGREDYFRVLSKSFMISADLAHAVHPNVGEKHDPVNRPIINNGPVIKVSANQRYTTDSNSSAIFEELCKRAGVPVQKFVNRSDERGGSTIGPISSTHLPIRSVDIGTPILAMHSVRELGGVKDHEYIIKVFQEFFEK